MFSIRGHKLCRTSGLCVPSIPGVFWFRTYQLGGTGQICLIIYPAIPLLTRSYTVDWHRIKSLIKMLKSFRGLSWSRPCAYRTHENSRLGLVGWSEISLGFSYSILINIQIKFRFKVFTCIMLRNIDLLIWVWQTLFECVCGVDSPCLGCSCVGKGTYGYC